MTHALIVLALAVAGAYLVRRAIRPAATGRAVDAGAVSTSWIAEHQREDTR